MISIIICSIKENFKDDISKNIKETIGNSSFEILIHNNKDANWGLSKVYNHYANNAKGDILCFIHEDIKILTNNWGKIIEEFYQAHPKAGVVGFAGSTMKTKTISGWVSEPDFVRENLIQHLHNGRIVKYKINPKNEDFTAALILDGLALFVTKQVWLNNPFDEILFTGFHFYDLDFSLQIAQTHNNYVCNSINLEHFSEGNYDSDWGISAKKFHLKWQNILPMALTSISKKERNKCELITAYKFAKNELELKNGEGKWKVFLTHCRECPSLIYNTKLAIHILTKIRL